MRLIDIVRDILLESVAAEEAHKLGLRYKGRGYWMDQTGKTVAKTVKDTLTKLDSEEDAKLNPSEVSQSPTIDTPVKSESLKDQIMSKKIGDNGTGSTQGAGIYQGIDGIDRYVKPYKDPSRSSCEKLACLIYRDAGVGAPYATTFDLNGKTAFASEIANGKLLGEMTLTPQLANKILDGFVADVFLANWDVIGLSKDNIIVSPQGTPIRIDNGGSLLFRAMETSGRKPDDSLESINEWYNFSSNANTQYKNVFQTAGFVDAEDMGFNRLNTQLKALQDVIVHYGGISEMVSTLSPEMNQNDKESVIIMLQARFQQLSEKILKMN